MHRNSSFKRTLAGMFTVLIGLMAWSGTAAATMTPTEYIKHHTADVTDLLAQEESEERARKFSEKAEKVIDFRTLASRALGKHWDARNDEERQEFLDHLQTLLEANYKNKLEGNEVGEDYTIEYLEEKQRDDRAIVRTRVAWGKSDKERKPVEYKLMKKENGWVVYDVVIDDISLEATYRDSYTKIIEEDGWDALIDKMEQKIKKIRADEGETGTAE
jgi:phospholipid transport system substrate-binding protein